MTSGPSGVLLLGMHRSGTSVATRLLVKLGMQPPPADDLMEADSENALGYWESKGLTELNDDLLAFLGSCWYAPATLDEVKERLPELQRFSAAAVSLAQAVLQGPWVWKDPRACLTLPFWDGVLGGQHPVIVVHRDPRDTVDSLVRRDAFTVPHALALWERHAIGALQAASGRAVHVESYEDLLEDPGGWCERVGSFLVAQGVLDKDDLPRELDFTDDLLRPRSRPEVTAAIELNARQNAVQEHLRSLSRHSWQSFAAPVPGAESEQGVALLEAHQEIWRGRRRLDDARAGAASDQASFEAERADASFRHDRLLARATALETELGQARELAAQQVARARAEVDIGLERERALRERLSVLEGSVTFRISAPVRRVYAAVRGRAPGQAP